MTEPKTTTTHILALASRPEGISSRCIPGMASEDLSARCCRMVKEGRLYRGGLGRGHVRYFTDEAAAKAYGAKQQPKLPARPLQQGKATWAKDAKTVITADTKVTLCPSHPPRVAAIDLPGVMTANQRGRVVGEPVDLAPARICPEVQA